MRQVPSLTVRNRQYFLYFLYVMSRKIIAANSRGIARLFSRYRQNPGRPRGTVSDRGAQYHLQVLLFAVRSYLRGDRFHQFGIGKELAGGFSAVGVKSADYDHHMAGLRIPYARD